MKKLFLFSLSAFMLFSCQNNSSNLVPLDQNNLQQTEIQSNKDKNKYGTAKRDLFLAQSTAKRWDISAELVKVEADFVYENGYANWVYYFKSPFKNTAYRVDGFNGQEVPNSFFGTQFSDFQLRVDSDKAIEKAKAKGLKRFPVNRITLERKFSALEWEIWSSEGTFRISAEN